MYHGILNLNKPGGWTSHDVVAKVRRILAQREVGHAGTLDPLATGVLLVCVGQATRVAEYLMAGDKVYRAEAWLGITTDTYDIDGRIIAEAPVPALTDSDVRQALARFVGTIQQAPPPYSAIKQAGVPAHRRARRGEAVELPARPTIIYDIRLLSLELRGAAHPALSFEVSCAPGTYIRSLVHDLGQALGCGAVLAGLTRLRSGRFDLADAVTPEALAEAAAQGRVSDLLQPLSAALAGLTAVHVDETAERQLRHGRAIPCPAPPPAATAYAVSVAGTAVAILKHDPLRGMWQPTKVFTLNHP